MITADNVALFQTEFANPLRDLLYHDPQIPYDAGKALSLRARFLEHCPDAVEMLSSSDVEDDDLALMLHLLTDEAFCADPYPVPATAAETLEEKKYALLLREYIHSLLQEMSVRFASGDVFDVYQANVASAPSFQTQIPVWICWWQGEEQMPEVVRMCVHSIRHALSGHPVEIHFITEQNYGRYVAFPQRILSLFRAGNITITHLTDLLRAELLSRYGGLYIDATYLVRGELPPEWFLPETFYTIRHKEPQPQYVSQGKWSQNLLKMPAGEPLARFLRNAFYLYWSEQEQLADYFLIDIIIEEASRSVPQIRERLSAVPPSMPYMEILVHNLNEAYDPATESVLTANTCVFKLSRKLPFHKETPDGRETLYGHLYREYENAEQHYD